MKCHYCGKPAHLFTPDEVLRTAEVKPEVKKHQKALLSLVGSVVHESGRFNCFGIRGVQFLRREDENSSSKNLRQEAN